MSLSSGQGEHRVHAHLMDCGVPAQEAEEILQAALQRVRSAQDKETNGEKLGYRLFGAFLCACGIGMLVFSYRAAKPGGSFMAPVGLIGFGSYMLATGSGK